MKNFFIAADFMQLLLCKKLLSPPAWNLTITYKLAPVAGSTFNFFKENQKMP